MPSRPRPSTSFAALSAAVFLAGLTAVPFVLGCGPSPRRIVLNDGTPPPNQGGVPGPTAGGTQPAATATGSSVERLNTVNSHLEQNGFSRVGSAFHNTSNQPVVPYAIDATAGQCYVAVALADSAANIDMVVVNPQGQPVAFNVAPDANPWVRFCASDSGRFVARVQSTQGGSAHYFAHYTGSNDPRLAAVLGGGEVRQNVGVEPQVQARIASLTQQLSGQGYRPLGSAQGYQLETSGTESIGVQLQAGTCYTFASLGGQGAQDTDLFLNTTSGESLESDASTALDASFEYCPASPGRYDLQARMYSGQGNLFVAVWGRQQNGNAAAVPDQPNVISGSSGVSGLAETFALVSADISARGYEVYGDSSQGRIGANESREFPITFEGGKCYALVAQGDGSVRDIDLVIRDSRGRELDRDVDQASRAVVRVCPERSGDYTLSVNMAQGSGEFMYQAYRWPRGTRGPFGLNGLIYVRLGEVTSLLGQEGYQASSTQPPGRGSLRRQGSTASHDIELPTGCSAVLVVGGDGVNDLNVALLQNGQALAAEDSRNAFPNVRHCSNSGGTATVRIEAAAGQGDYYYQI
ncbi:MAG: hypothetical protein AAF938_28225, partial [Myxococcota bacterium]